MIIYWVVWNCGDPNWSSCYQNYTATILKHSILTCLLCLGSAMPLMAQAATPGALYGRSHQMAIASADLPTDGTYADRDWSVALIYTGGTYKYYGSNNCDQSQISLSGAVVSGTKSRRIYTWNNNGTKYRVTRQANDNSTIRLQVVSPKGVVILNRLLKWTDDPR